MFSCSKVNANYYKEQMEAIKKLNYEKQAIQSSDEYKKGNVLNRFERLSYKEKLKLILNRLFKKKNDKESVWSKYKKDLPTAINHREECNYFSNDKIAVYTCIIGKYDSLQEPLIQPDNIDYYAITDFTIPSESKWKRIDASTFMEVEGFSPILTNRYFKINPHVVFQNYRYSIYVDGNFRICSDITEHVNRMSKYSFSHFKHSKRTCAYEEAEVCRLLGKEKSENIDVYIERLKSAGFPQNYGLLACDILVREHNEPECITIMEQWWYEFKNYVKRDQLSLPFVLFENGISVDDVTTLGGDVHKEYSFEILRHQ